MNTRNVPIVELGGFIQGTIPPPIEHWFADEYGQFYDLDDWDVVGFSFDGPAGASITGVVTIDQDATGKVVFTFAPDDLMVPGTYEAVISIVDDAADPALKLNSALFRWRVYPAPGGSGES